jgi:hypothetical protein
MRLELVLTHQLLEELSSEILLCVNIHNKRNIREVRVGDEQPNLNRSFYRFLGGKLVAKEQWPTFL